MNRAHMDIIALYLGSLRKGEITMLYYRTAHSLLAFPCCNTGLFTSREDMAGKGCWGD